ncbi:glycosyltransferase [Nocardioides sp. CER19]|uniref:glycosyltransferase n=1 Tax=Nocardioides sp. CER19 TaxID=3038538 RepID=UPI002446E26E|nr:glycosyltransferase [Nocardioides sp. CER19]MDH2416769.1 glycosyltransferase [Nocardioides sp. CER19]
MSEAPVVEICMPFHGDPGLFRRAVASVVSQSDGAWTLRVIEDGHQPGFDAAAWIASLGDTRISHAQNASQLGVCGNFQKCLDTSTAPYIVFFGCDDVMLPDYVRVLRGMISRFGGADVLSPGVSVIDGRGHLTRPVGDRIKRALAPRIGQPTELEGERLVTSLMHGNWTYFPALCWRRDAIAALGFRDDLPTTLDLELLVRVLMQGGSLALDPTVVFHYRRHGDSASSLTAASRERFDEEARLLDEIAGRCESAGWKRAARAARWRVTSRLHHLLIRARGPLVA